VNEAELITLVRDMPECVEGSHLGTVDFRVRNKIFCTFPKPGEMVLKLTPEQQELLVAAEGETFAPIRNNWGRKGWTIARVEKLDATTAQSALRMAWGNVAPKSLRRA
jgi:hypothetical protein